jgi:hypothetical protein
MRHFWILAALATVAFAADDVVTAVSGTVKTVDAATKTVVIKAADGTEHTFHVAARATVHGAEDVGKGSKDAYHSLKEGNEVVVHYTVKGTEKTAEEFDRVGKDGLHVAEGTVKGIDRGAKTITVKTADGAEATYHFTAHVTSETGKDVADGTVKAGKVTVYYTEDAGRKIVHFFKSN